MERHFKITIDGQAYDVLVEEIMPGAGTLYPDRGALPAASADAARPSVASAGAPAAPAPSAERPPDAPALAAGPGDVVCPLSGVVVSLHVELGAKVSEGARVVTLEAMKTKTVVTAPRSGKISAIAVKPGDAIETGQTMLTIA